MDPTTGRNTIVLDETVGLTMHSENNGKVQAVARYRAGVTTGWVARMRRAEPNPENAFYRRKYLRSSKIIGNEGFGHNVFWLDEGIYEAEHDVNGSPFRTMFEVRNGTVAWLSSVTLQKKASLLKARVALGAI